MTLIQSSVPISTTAINVIFLNKLKKAGFDNGQDCEIEIKIVGDMPEYYVTKAEGLHLKTALGFDIKCKKHADSTEFSQVMTILTKEIDFITKVSKAGIVFYI